MINPNTVRLNDAELPNVMGDYSSENFLYDAAGRLLVARLNCSGQQLNIACVYVQLIALSALLGWKTQQISWSRLRVASYVT